MNQNIERVVLPDGHNGVTLQLPSLAAEDSDGIREEDGVVVEKGQELFFYDNASAELTELPRIRTCAIFHKLTGSHGVPHSFYGEFFFSFLY